MYVSLPALTETCFEVNTLGEFAPDRSVCSVGEGTEGGGVLAAPATSNSRDLIEYMTADAWFIAFHNVGNRATFKQS